MRAQSLANMMAFLLATLFLASGVQASPLTYQIALSGKYADAAGGGPAAGAGSFTIDGLDPDPTQNTPQYLSTLPNVPNAAPTFDLLSFDLAIEGHSYAVADITLLTIVADTAGLIYTFGLQIHEDLPSQAGVVIQFISDAAFDSDTGFDPSFWVATGPEGFPTQYYAGGGQAFVEVSRVSVPEPGTALLCCTMLAALGWSRRKASANPGQ